MTRTITILLVAALFASCIKDLDRFPANDKTSEDVYADFNGYKQVFAKVYASYATIGNNTTGADDIPMADGALTDFIRCWFNLQCLTTEEAAYTWADAGCPELNFMTWTTSNPFVAGLYYRSMYQITLANEFLREATPEKLELRGITGSEADMVASFRYEVRFLRAFQYWVLMDFIGNPSFIDENSTIGGKYLPQQKTRTEIFDYVESELLAIKDELKEPRTNEYGRADRAAAWALLARMYLNAEVYTGTARYTDAITYCQAVLSAGYDLKDDYSSLFLADNNLNNPEVILSVNYDGFHTQGYGGLTYIINSSYKPQRSGDTTNYNNYYGTKGMGGWYSFRTRKQLAEKFDNADTRRLLIGTKMDIDDITEFEDGLMGAKFRNVTSTGVLGSNPEAMFVDNDFPLFRLAEIYLIYAEAVKRGGTGGSENTALGYLNDLRTRAGLTTIGSYDLDYVLDERARELWWECFRRTDLVRYGRYTSGNYLWQWKGGVKEGTSVGEHLNLFPIPSADMIANPNLKQNAGY
ncbi:MAG: RagB/SusD family nutrient uptake outer membrane protein [Bacteroidales bacterium]|jgi:hypothetical protein|nr:RagB/SusD family nutrient uptake outer membrane protein [Bacteroidales bacterium]